MQEDKWSSEPARSYMPLQTSYSPYPSDFTNQPPAPMPGMTNSSPMPG
jgi:hypothetical protein